MTSNMEKCSSPKVPLLSDSQTKFRDASLVAKVQNLKAQRNLKVSWIQMTHDFYHTLKNALSLGLHTSGGWWTYYQQSYLLPSPTAKPRIKFFPMSHCKSYHPHQSPEHSWSRTCRHRWVQHWFLPCVNLLPGKPTGPQGHAITTVAIVLLKGTATCRQKRHG